MRDFHADRLRSFLAVARAGGFSRAARVLGQSQSSVSQAVALLENELGERLFERTGRTIHLTEAGQILAGHAERIFAELEAAHRHLAELRDLSAGRLTVGTSDTLATHLLPPVLAAFRAAHPAIELRLVNCPSPAVASGVARRELDLGIATTPLPPAVLRAEGTSAVQVELLQRQRDVLICPPGHPLARRRRLQLRELSGEPLLLLDRSTASRAHLETSFAARGLNPRVVMEMSSVEVLKRLVELGFGLSIVPEVATAAEVARRSLAAVRLPRGPLPRHVVLLTRAAAPPTRAASAFIAVVRSQLARTGES
jgi:DNA-binding transcriptional LysR family regulator